jgi:hypothetical protein
VQQQVAAGPRLDQAFRRGVASDENGRDVVVVFEAQTLDGLRAGLATAQAIVAEDQHRHLLDVAQLRQQVGDAGRLDHAVPPTGEKRAHAGAHVGIIVDHQQQFARRMRTGDVRRRRRGIGGTRIACGHRQAQGECGAAPGV